MKRFIYIGALFLMVLSLKVSGQETGVPALGAQVFVEPGQTPEQIDSWFGCLESSGFSFARIRMFGSHMLRQDGSWDFELYDQAFKAAERHNIKLFATLFPVTDELTDVGGFKFPKDDKNLEAVGDYIDHVVGHFKDFPALYAWVLQNEPGPGSMKAPSTPLSEKMRRELEAGRTKEERTGYLKADFSEQEFLRRYTVWYLDWIDKRISATDAGHYRHINPHQILSTLPEYDFRALGDIITSLGASMHLSWHFGYFERPEFPVGVSLMSDIIRSSALDKPFWITELQGGNVTASGYRVLCPTATEIPQWLWTGISAGAEGVIFWTLNQRAAVSEAGEWGLLTYQNTPSDRLSAAAEVASTLSSHKDVFENASPAGSGITVLYNTPSLWMQKINAATIKDTENEGRSDGAVMKSIAAAYEAICSWGVTPQVCDMEYFDWNDAEGKAVVLPDVISIPSCYYDSIRRFVENGGRLIATGLTGYYDGTMKCSFMGGFPLADVFGADISEFKAEADYFSLPPVAGCKLESHLFRGVIQPDGAEVMTFFGNDPCAVRHTYGKGEVIWVPAMIDLGCWHRNEKALSLFYGNMLKKEIASAPVRLRRPAGGLLIRTMDCGDKLVTVIINKSGRRIKARISTEAGNPEIIYGSGSVSPRRIRIGDEETIVTVWNNKQQ